MDAVAIEIGVQSWKLLHLRSSIARQRVVGQIEITGALAERVCAVKEYISKNGLSGVRLAVVLPRRLSISRMVSIPAPSRSALDGMVRFELEKHLPFSPSEAYYGYQVLGNKGNEYSVLLGVAVKKRVDEIVSSFTAAGLDTPSVFFWQGAIMSSIANLNTREGKTAIVSGNTDEFTIDIFSESLPGYSKLVLIYDNADAPVQILRSELTRAAMANGCQLEDLKIIFLGKSDSICPEDMADNIFKLDKEIGPDFLAAFGGALSAIGTGRCSINLLPTGRPEQLKYLPTAVLLAVAMVLLSLVGVSYIAKDMITVKRLDRNLAELKAMKESTGDMPGRTAGIRVNALESIYSSPSTMVLDIIKEITEILPDDSWLTYLEFKDGSVTFEGISGNAPALLIQLENSRFLDDFEFTAPVTAISKGKEKFRIKSEAREKSARI